MKILFPLYISFLIIHTNSKKDDSVGNAYHSSQLEDQCQPNDPSSCIEIENGGCCTEWTTIHYENNKFLYAELDKVYN